MSIGVNATITRSHLFRSRLPRTAVVVVVFLSPAITGSGSLSGQEAAPRSGQQADHSEQNPDVNVLSYVNEPLASLVQRISELQTLQPASDQSPLPMILDKTGERIDEFSHKLGGLVAKEVVSDERLDPITGKPLKFEGDRMNGQTNQISIQQDQYTYFIVDKGNQLQFVIEEYRRDASGNEGPPEVKFLSTGFAASVLHFAKPLQLESTYRYLGEDVVGMRNAYVVAFAQNPWEATFKYKMRKPDGSVLYVLMQGIAWVDASNFQILRIRTDIMPSGIPLEEQEGKDQLRTVVTFGEIQPEGAPSSMWLPTEAHVHEEIGAVFQNVHHFSDYRRYYGPEGYTASFGQRNDAGAHPYLEVPPKELVKRVPELKGIRLAADQHALPTILNKTGKEVDEFFDNLVDLVAREEIKQERLGSFGSARASESVRDSYLILRHANGTRADFDEFRMDEQGNRMDQAGLGRGFLVTSGFALICVHFSLEFQWDSRFRYLGDQKINGRDTYAVAFAQLPGMAHLSVTMRGPRGTAAHMLMQGVVWVDKVNFHIVQMRTDLLARQPEIGLDEQTTKVNFSEVRLQDLATPLWLPRDVNVYVKLGADGERHFEEEFRNVHHYTDYRRYRVSTKMVTPQ